MDTIWQWVELFWKWGLRNINPDDGIKINSFHKESIHKLEEKIFLTGYKNLQTFNLLRKSNLILSTFFTKIPDRKFDLICCNPPYVSKNQYLSLENTVKLYEPKNALVSDNGGYSHIKKIAKESTNYLKKDAKIFFEVGIGQAKHAKEILFNLGYSDLVTYNDLNNIERIVAGKWKN